MSDVAPSSKVHLSQDSQFTIPKKPLLHPHPAPPTLVEYRIQTGKGSDNITHFILSNPPCLPNKNGNVTTPQNQPYTLSFHDVYVPESYTLPRATPHPQLLFIWAYYVLSTSHQVVRST